MRHSLGALCDNLQILNELIWGPGLIDFTEICNSYHFIVLCKLKFKIYLLKLNILNINTETINK